ncbi:MAG TPA: hypothetical protein VGO59_20555 [Verrucomicrobiae bacterium]|jgi:hypothetical protein
MKNYLKLALILPITIVAGCSTIIRENIVTSVDTGIGASLAENKQTQMYEMKVGYIRSQFYSVPTGKVVANEGKTAITGEEDLRTNAADVTPQLVSGIRMHSGLQDLLLGLDVSENFAVGATAVQSQAAVAMYIATAQSPTNAQAASTAVSALTTINSPPNTDLRAQYDTAIVKPLKSAKNADGSAFTGTTQQYADYLANVISPGATAAQIRALAGDNLQKLVTQLTAAQ